MQSLTFFNNKGGVGKTTLLCNVAAYFSIDKGKSVLIVDADPQCNATQYMFKEPALSGFYERSDSFTIYDIVRPLSHGKGYASKIEPQRADRFAVDVIPGDPSLALTEDLLARDWGSATGGDIRGIRTTLLFSELLRRCGSYDLVIFDVGPSLGSINRAVLLASDYFVAPMSIDIFSIKAIDNIAVWLRTWRKQWRAALANAEDIDDDLSHAHNISFLGYVSQQYIAKTKDGSKRAVNAYDKIMSQFESVITKKLIPEIGSDNRTIGGGFSLGSIPNLHSLIPMSQSNRAPVFELRSSDGVRGAHFTKVKDSRAIFGEVGDQILFKMSMDDAHQLA